MFLNLFGKGKKSVLGIDIGTSSIKMVQLKRVDERYKLETYGKLQTYGYLERLNDPFHTKSLRLLESQIVELIGKLLKKAETTSNQVVMSIPVFSSFISVVEMPPMPEKELSQALTFEAKRYIPVPLSEVRIDWKVIDREDAGFSKNKNKNLFKFKILLVAVPKEIIDKYLRIAQGLELKLQGLELESFSYLRSFMGDDKSTACILDLGARSTSFTIADKGFVQMSHGLDIAGAELTKALAHGMGVDFKRAEEYKRQKGLDHKKLSAEKETRDILLTFVDKIILEAQRMINAYQSETDRKVTKLILAGGSGNLIGLKEHLEKKLDIKVVVGNPWARIDYPSFLEPVIKEIAPQFAVAVGSAMREL